MFNKNKMNCWEYRKCGFGPDSVRPCLVATDTTSDGVNCGKNAGRICWTVPNTPCFNFSMGEYAEKRSICRTCEFFRHVQEEEGSNFHIVKLAQGVKNTRELRSTISHMEHLIDIWNRLQSHFDLQAVLNELTSEARKITGAQRSLVFLLKGDPPALYSEFKLRGKRIDVVIGADDSSAVGFAAKHNEVVNMRDLYSDLYKDQSSKVSLVFNTAFDRQCNCKTHSFLAVPFQNSEKKTIGVITAANAKKGFFSADDEWFMRTYATEVALAVEKHNFLEQSLSALRLASIGETVAGLSHCIKNIAHALRGSSYIIKKALESGNVRDIKAAWEILDRHIESLADLSVDVLTYDPTTDRGIKGNKLNEIVRYVIELFQEEAKARAAILRGDLGISVDPFNFDRRGIYRCLVNLIINALDACPLSDGMVVVSTRRTGEKELELSVSDNGQGIDEKQKSELFELFKTTKLGKGSGLGLPTVAAIVKKHDGRIEIDSKPGKGTTIRIYLQEQTE